MQFGRAQAGNRSIPGAVATLGVDERRAFIKRTYVHLAFALLGFVAMSYLIYDTGISTSMVVWLATSGGGYGWLLFLGLFMLVSWVADKWARSDTSPTMQYLGLGLYVVAESLIFGPLLLIASMQTDASIIPNAAALTVCLFLGLTGTVFITKKDFSFLRGALAIGGMAAMGMIVMGIIFGFQLGLFFAGFMIVFAGGVILYQTSQILAHYRPTQHVAAALGLFAAIALMFYYILIFFLQMSRD